MGVVAAAAAEEGQVAAGFEAALAVTALRAGRALETSRILFLELVGGEEDALGFGLSLAPLFVSNQDEGNFSSLWCINIYLNIRRRS